jgi:uncharacterized membrane protein required for colicin V production
MELTLFDQVTIGLMLIAGLIGFSMGTLRTGLNLVICGLALAAAIVATNEPQIVRLVASPDLSTLSVKVNVFVIVFFALQLLGMLLNYAVDVTRTSADLDIASRIIGFALGATQALFVMTMLFLMNAAGFRLIFQDPASPFKSSFTYPMIKAMGTAIIEVAMPFLPPEFAAPVSGIWL